MVDAHGREVWCPWVPSCDLSAISSLGQSSSWSFPSFLDESAGISTGVYDPYEYPPSSPLLPTSPTCAASDGHHSGSRPHSPDPAKTAEISPLASLAARFCTPASSAVGKASGHASPPTTAPGIAPISTRPSSAAAAASVKDARHELLLKGQACHNHSSPQAVLPSSVTHVGEDRTRDAHQQSPCTAGYPPVAAQSFIPAATHAHVHQDPGQAPGHNEWSLSGEECKQSQASGAEPSEDLHGSVPLQQQLQQQQEAGATRRRKGNGCFAAIASPLFEDDSDDADLLIDLSWANVQASRKQLTYDGVNIMMVAPKRHDGP